MELAVEKVHLVFPDFSSKATIWDLPFPPSSKVAPKTRPSTSNGLTFQVFPPKFPVHLS
ncbi:hypothetical protein D3C86_1724180 [compost metagenome]